MGLAKEVHRPGLLKQQNKAHKHGHHRSKSELRLAGKVKVPLKISRRAKVQNGREERRNQMAQNRLKKRSEVLEKKRQLGSVRTAPFLIAVVPLSVDVNVQKFMRVVEECTDEIESVKTSEGVLHLWMNRFKQKFSFVFPKRGNLFAILDSLKVADTVLFVVSALSKPYVDEVSQDIMTSILAQGLPATTVAVMELENVPKKKVSNCKQEIQKIINQWLPEDKIMTVDKSVDAQNLLRKIGSQKQRSVFQRDHRPHILAEHLEFVKDENSDFGVLKASGYLRGQTLSANSLIHIPGWGDFQMKQIDECIGPLHLFRKELLDNESHVTSQVLEVADPAKRTSLMSENVPDEMDAEQTWPTEKELEVAKEKQKKLVKKIPKGMSDYQACWIPDVEEVDDSEDEVDDELKEFKEAEMELDDVEEAEKSEDDEEYETVTVGEMDAQKYDQEMDLEEEKKAQEMIKEAKMDQMFPDEVDTPQDVPARDRFQKYRGLASFRTSPWDPRENLPYDYAKIFQFENFARTRKYVLSQIRDELAKGVAPGLFVTIHVENVPWEKFKEHKPSEPLVMYGLLEHERKMSVVNMVMKRNPNTAWAELPIKSKEELVIQCGYRRYKARPVYSQHTNGSKHKYERYFQPNSIVVATTFAPIIFQPASVLAFKENPNGTLDLVASGQVLSVNPDRLIIKRVVLSGHPFKINKKSAVIRFMFFNREDINWFKPVELKTKYGRRGHIKEALGTHGHFKAVFDGQLKSQDTVLLYLYKRVFPKWSYEENTKYSQCRYRNLQTIFEMETD
ncbi:UNVERIFIED_CONTAM: hypothetical protein PYX00_007354 [Menopon gallinae]|uniref:Pre-rRNA-processing protein TSR1 homolog n=1 Tax=Menopon gallinae TaxID=328185 RepID=A0AAW2HIU8_9NEOP